MASKKVNSYRCLILFSNTLEKNQQQQIDTTTAYMDSVIKRLYEIHKRGSEVISDYYAKKKKINSTD